MCPRIHIPGGFYFFCDIVTINVKRLVAKADIVRAKLSCFNLRKIGKY